MYNFVMTALSAISGIAVSSGILPIIGDVITVYVGDNDAFDEYIGEDFPPVFDEVAFADIVAFLVTNTKCITTAIDGKYLVNIYDFDSFIVRILFLLEK